MFLDDLATELLTQVLLSCASIADVLNLASTCHRLHAIYTSSCKLQILAQAAEQQYGPLEDAIQLVTHNASQATHILRTVPLSMALLTQIVHVGRVATRWEDIYPQKKWKANFCDRRLLTMSERRAFRRALYRLWLYTRAFHNAAHPRLTRLHPPIVRERAALLHNWSTRELAEIADVHALLRDVLASNICPSNGTILHKFRKRIPDPAAQLMFNLHLNYPLSQPAVTPLSSHHQHLSIYPTAPTPTIFPPYQHPHQQIHPYQHYTPPYHHQPLHPHHNHNYHHPQQQHQHHPTPRRYRLFDAAFSTTEGWGDAITHYYTIEDMLKLDPAQILWLRERGCAKAQTEAFVKGLGEWFENNGETWGQTVQFVLHERGEVGVEEFVGLVASGVWGVVKAVGGARDGRDEDEDEDDDDGEGVGSEVGCGVEDDEENERDVVDGLVERCAQLVV